MPSKVTLFQQGSAAAAAVFGVEDIYICPLCQLSLDRAALTRGELTAEHVPPASRGGKTIILTCRACNNAAGHGVDAEAARREQAARFKEVFVDGKPGNAGRLTITWGNQPLTVDASMGDDGVTELKIVGTANDPMRIQAAHDHMKALSAAGKTDGYTMQAKSFVRYHPRKARISDLRAAFLACSAKFGYQYACHPVLSSIRKQIQDADSRILETWWIDNNANAMDSRIVICDPIGVVVVTFCGTTVLLPWPTRPFSDYLEAMKNFWIKKSFTSPSAHNCPWPTSFEAILDRQ